MLENACMLKGNVLGTATCVHSNLHNQLLNEVRVTDAVEPTSRSHIQQQGSRAGSAVA